MPYRTTESTRRRADERRSALIQATWAIVAAQGFAGASVTEVSRAAGTSTGLLYSYFGGRDELLAEVFRQAATQELEVVRTAVGAAGPPAPARLDALVRTFAGRALRGRQLAWALLFEPVSTLVEAERLAFRRAYAQLGEDIVRDGVAHGVFRQQNVPLAASALMGAISEALIGRLSPLVTDVGAMPADVVVQEIGTFCARALGSSPPILEEIPT